MANKKLGFIKLYRAIQENWLWKYNEPFDHRSAWIDLLLMVNHKEEKLPVGTRIQIIKPGQRWLSYRQLGSRWGWSYRKVMRFMEQLVSDHMVYVDGTPNGTLLTIVNWGSFNSQRITDGTPDDTTDGTPDGITPVITRESRTAYKQEVKECNKNDKEVKEEEPAPPFHGGEWQ